MRQEKCYIYDHGIFWIGRKPLQSEEQLCFYTTSIRNMHHNLESKFPHSLFHVVKELLDKRLEDRFSIFTCTCTIMKKTPIKTIM